MRAFLQFHSGPVSQKLSWSKTKKSYIIFSVGFNHGDWRVRIQVDECQAEMRERVEVHLIHQLVSNYGHSDI